MADETEFETRAADGGRRQPAANTLSDLIVMLGDGEFNSDTYERLRLFATKLEALGVDSGKKAKGMITLKIAVTFDPDREFSELTPSLSLKLPEARERTTIAWFTSDGRLTPNKPRQGNLFGTIREIVSEPREVREATNT